MREDIERDFPRLIELGYEKTSDDNIADNGIAHAAKQLPDGRWSSRLGEAEDIAHVAPNDAAGEMNGWPARYMKRVEQ